MPDPPDSTSKVSVQQLQDNLKNLTACRQDLEEAIEKLTPLWSFWLRNDAAAALEREIGVTEFERSKLTTDERKDGYTNVRKGLNGLLAKAEKLLRWECDQDYGEDRPSEVEDLVGRINKNYSEIELLIKQVEWRIGGFEALGR